MNILLDKPAVTIVTKSLIDLIQQKKKRYQDMLDISYIQETLIQDGKTAELWANIELRQKAIEDIDEINIQIDAIDCYQDPQYLEIEQEIVQIQRELTHQDRINESATQSKIIEYTVAIKKGNNARKSLSYGDFTNFNTTSFFLDEMK